MRHHLLLASLCLLLCHATFAQNPFDAAAEETAIRAVIVQYFDAWARRDLEAYMSHWSGIERERTRRRELMQRRFAEEEIRFSPPAITRLVQQFGAATVYVKTTRRTRQLNNSQDGTISPMHIVFTLAKEDVWRITREQPAAVAFMSELLTASEAEQNRLLESDAAMIDTDLARALAAQSDNAFTRGDQVGALKSLKLLRRVATQLNDQTVLADAWFNTGIAEFILRNNEAARAAYQQALTLNQQLQRHAETARSLTSLALVANATRHQPQWAQQAIAYYQQALPLFEALNEKLEIAAIHESISTVHYDAGDYAKALASLRASIDAAGGKVSTIVANRFSKIAKIEYEQGRDAEALAAYQNALAQLFAINDIKQRGFIFHSIANLYYTQGDLGQALRFYERSRDAEREAKAALGEAGAWQGIGLVHSLNGNFAAALTAFRANLAYWQTRSDKAELAAAMQRVASTHFSLGQYQEARTIYQEVVALREVLGDKFELAKALLDIGIVNATLGSFDAALEQYAKSRALFAESNQPAGSASVMLNVAALYFQQQNYTQSLTAAEEAASFAKTANENTLRWQALHRAGRCHYRLEQHPQARAALLEAVALIEAQPTALHTQASTTSNSTLPYLALVDVSLALKQGIEAFHFSERAKARGLLNLLQGHQSAITKTMTPLEQKREREFLNSLASLQARLLRELEKAASSSGGDQKRIAELKQAQQTTRANYESFLQKLYVTHPRLKQLRGYLKPVTSPQATALVNDARSALLAFCESEERVYLFAFTRPTKPNGSPLQIYMLAPTRAEVSLRMAQWQQLTDAQVTERETMASELYQWLLQPAAAQLAGKTRLLIAPDGWLWNVPFEALRDAESRWLIETNEISYAPSLTALPLMRSPIARRGNTFAAYLNPALSDETRERWQALTGKPLVTNETNGTWAASVQAQTGAAANESSLVTALPQAGILHLGAPALLNETHPFFSAIALAPQTPADGPLADGPLADGWLEAREIFAASTSARLVTTAASETTASLHTGRGFVGLHWAFLVAGCPAVLTGNGDDALWQEFYRRLPQASAAQAWQAAVRNQLSASDTRWMRYRLMDAL